MLGALEVQTRSGLSRRFFRYPLLAPISKQGSMKAYTPQCTSIKGFMVSIRWCLGFLKGELGGAYLGLVLGWVVV